MGHSGDHAAWRCGTQVGSLPVLNLGSVHSAPVHGGSAKSETKWRCKMPLCSSSLWGVLGRGLVEAKGTSD